MVEPLGEIHWASLLRRRPKPDLTCNDLEKRMCLAVFGDQRSYSRITEFLLEGPISSETVLVNKAVDHRSLAAKQDVRQHTSRQALRHSF